MLRRLELRPDPTARKTWEEVQRILRPLSRRELGVLDSVRTIAYQNIDDALDPTIEGQLVLGLLVAIAAPHDDQARAAVQAEYDTMTDQLEAMYDGALIALERETIDELPDGSRTLAMLITAIVDGLLLRARIDPDLDAPRLFADAIVPLIIGLTRHRDDPQPDWYAALRRSRRGRR